jgi:hypothetical protein
MLTIFVQLLQQIFHALVHEWDTLVRKVGKRTANVLLTYLALGVILEIFWLTLMISVLMLINILD